MATAGAWRDATFLFTDLANFTPLLEASPPDVIVKILNDYLDGVIEAVFARLGQLFEIPVGDTTSVFDDAHCVNQSLGNVPTRDRKVINSSLSLGAVVCFGGNFNRSHGIGFGTLV